MDEQVDVIMFTVKLNQLGFKAFADIGENILHEIEHGFVKDFSPIFCHEDQMDMHIENAVSPCSHSG